MSTEQIIALVVFALIFFGVRVYHIWKYIKKNK